MLSIFCNYLEVSHVLLSPVSYSLVQKHSDAHGPEFYPF